MKKLIFVTLLTLLNAGQAFAKAHIPLLGGNSNSPAQLELDSLGCRELYKPEEYRPTSDGAKMYSQRVFLDFSANDYGYNYFTGVATSLRFRKAAGSGGYDIEIVRTPGWGYAKRQARKFRDDEAKFNNAMDEAEESILFAPNVQMKDRDILIRYGFTKRIRIQCGTSLYTEGQPLLVIK